MGHPRTRRSSIAAHVAKGEIARCQADEARLVRANSLMRSSSRAPSRASRLSKGSDSMDMQEMTPQQKASVAADPIMFSVFEPESEVLIMDDSTLEAEAACKHYIDLMTIPRPSPPPSRQGIAQLFSGRSVRYEPIGKPHILLEAGKGIEQLLTKSAATLAAEARKASEEQRVAKKRARRERAEKITMSDGFIIDLSEKAETDEGDNDKADEEVKEVRLTEEMIKRASIRRRQAQTKAKKNIVESNNTSKQCSQARRVVSDVCNANCRLDWLPGSGVDLDKLCEADLSDSDDDSKYEGTDLANKSRYIEINSLPGLTEGLLKSSTVKHKVFGALRKGGIVAPSKEKKDNQKVDWITMNWDQYEAKICHEMPQSVVNLIGAGLSLKKTKSGIAGSLPVKAALGSGFGLLKKGKTPKVPTDKEKVPETAREKVSLPLISPPRRSSGSGKKVAPAEIVAPLTARVTKKETSDALHSLLKRGRLDHSIFFTSALPDAMLQLKKRTNQFKDAIWDNRQLAIDVEHRAAAGWNAACRRSYDNQRFKRQVLGRAIEQGINECHISVEDVRQSAAVQSMSDHLGFQSDSACYQALQGRLKQMRKKEPVESETSKLYEQFSLLIEQEGYLNVDVVLSVIRAQAPLTPQMQELVDVLLAVLRVPVSFYTAWCMLHSISPGLRVKAQMKERQILFQRRMWLTKQHDDKKPPNPAASPSATQELVRGQSTDILAATGGDWLGGLQHPQVPAKRRQSILEVVPTPPQIDQQPTGRAFITETQICDRTPRMSQNDRMRARLGRILLRSDQTPDHITLAHRLCGAKRRPRKVLSQREAGLIKGAENRIEIIPKQGYKTKAIIPVATPIAVKKIPPKSIRRKITEQVLRSTGRKGRRRTIPTVVTPNPMKGLMVLDRTHSF